MTTTPLIPNHLEVERLAAGFDTPEEFAAAVDVDPEWYAHLEARDVLSTHDELDRMPTALGGILRSRI